MLIAISGKIGSGKDTVALMLSYLLYCKRENKPENWFSYEMFNDVILKSVKGICQVICRNRIHKFADTLKDILALCLGRDRFEFEDRNFKNEEIFWLNDMTVRELLQRVGEGFRTQVSEDFWIKCLLHKYKESYTWFISDLRYLNEAQACKQLGGILIRVDRPGIREREHISETQLDNYPYFDYKINNNKGLIELFEECKKIINDIK